MSDSLAKPHDLFFKEVFSNPLQARIMLRDYLPPLLASQLDLSSLELDPASYVNEELEERFADLVFRCKVNDSRQQVQFALLLEHKSYVSGNIYFQLARYMFDLWEHQKAAKQPFMPVIPVVFYHGERDWQPKPMAETLLDPYPETGIPFLPSFQFVLINLRSLPREYILARSTDSAVVQRAMLVFKLVLSEDVLAYLTELLDPTFIESENELHDRFYRSLIVYLSHGSKANKENIMNTLSEKWRKIQYEPGSPVDQWVQESIEKGIGIGIEKGLGKGLEIIRHYRAGKSPEEIARITEIDIERVKETIRQWTEQMD